MARRLSFSHAAIADLDTIWDYTERLWGREQARDYTSGLNARCLELAAGDLPVRPLEVRGRLYVRARHGSHTIFALEAEDRLLVVRILHVRQDLEGQLPHSTQSRPISR